MKLVTLCLSCCFIFSFLEAKAESIRLKQCRNFYERMPQKGNVQKPNREDCEQCKTLCQEAMSESGSPNSSDFKQAQSYRLHCTNVCK